MKTQDDSSELEDKKFYLYRNGKQQMDVYDFFKEIGWIDRLSEKGFVINPTHNYTELKEVRLRQFEKVKAQFIEERTMKRLQTEELDLHGCYYAWLKRELDVIEKWAPTDPVKARETPRYSTSDQIEIAKYRKFVKDEMEKVELKTNPQKANQVFDPNDPLKNYNEFKWTLESFFNNVYLYVHDSKKLRNYCREEYDEVHNTAHRAQQEIERLLFANNTGAEGLKKELIAFVKRSIEQDSKVKKELKIIGGNSWLNAEPYFSVVQPLFELQAFLMHQDIIPMPVEVQMEIEFKEHWANAVNETKHFFLRSHQLQADERVMKSVLQKEHKYFKEQFQINNRLRRQDRLEDLKKALSQYADDVERQLSRITLNENGYVSNAKPVNVVAEYCQLAFCRAFHTKELEKLVSNRSRIAVAMQSEAKVIEPPKRKTVLPVINNEAISELFTILTPFFPDQQEALMTCLKTGETTSKIIFTGNGNRLVDTFRQLYESNLLSVLNKNELSQWICNSFQYSKDGSILDYNLKTVNRLISENGAPCKTPIIRIKEGKVLLAEELRIKKVTKP